jgi:hypothetical protein
MLYGNNPAGFSGQVSGHLHVAARRPVGNGESGCFLGAAVFYGVKHPVAPAIAQYGINPMGASKK